MNLEYINSHSVIERYILGQLSEQEQVEFELYYLENPDILDEVEEARSLKRVLSNNQSLLVDDTVTAPTETRFSLTEKLRDWFQLPGVLAGNFAVMAILLVMVTMRTTDPSPTAFTAERVWIGQLRGERASLAIESVSGNVAFDIEVDDIGPFQVSLLDSQGGKVRSLEDVMATSGALLVVIDTAGLLGEQYTLTVNGPGDVLVISRDILIDPPD